MIEKVSQCLLVVGAGLDDELSNGRTRRRPRLSEGPTGKRRRVAPMHRNAITRNALPPNLNQGRLAGYDAGILFTEKEEDVCFMCGTF